MVLETIVRMGPETSSLLRKRTFITFRSIKLNKESRQPKEEKRQKNLPHDPWAGKLMYRGHDPLKLVSCAQSRGCKKDGI